MLTIDREHNISTHKSDAMRSRYTYIDKTLVYEYESKSSDYASLEVSLHDAKLETLTTRTKTINLANGKKCKIKILSFTRDDGVKNEISIYGEEY